ncbi:hypothetical protein DLAC_04616 [Tieghemostelium lacteum]|uniref:Paramecium surface antigen repeat-containing protein n=1 Tax=Tieghemostelium lacteum TaxID=361077 RepID=A0A151ZK60_TIELA|nr:hypothetical protein DLAC_04616 [Tieghemostelium lacteum]|eukprot:KYQ94317.1 hypothetical protein DLAC_04616 [Tieghemostelium lacteum]
MSNYFLIYFLVSISLLFNINAQDNSSITAVDDIIGRPNNFMNTELSCSVNLCSDLGGPCSNDDLFSGFKCQVKYRCLNGTCVESIEIGDICSNNYDCVLGSSCIKEPDGKNRCRKANYLEFGDACTYCYECDLELQCLGGICSTPQTGCVNDIQCNKSSICVDKKCQEVTLAPNQCLINKAIPCITTGQPCALESMNSTSIGVCKNITTGSLCLLSKYSCNWNVGHYCKPLPGDPMFGVCMDSPPPSFDTCFSQKECKEWEYCKCDRNSGVGYCTTRYTFLGSLCRDNFIRFLKCFIPSGCQVPFTSNPESCVYKNCQIETECLLAFCTEPLLPIEVCFDRKCILPFAQETNASSHYVIKNSQSTKLLLCNNNIFSNRFILFIVILSFLILIY